MPTTMLNFVWTKTKVRVSRTLAGTGTHVAGPRGNEEALPLEFLLELKVLNSTKVKSMRAVFADANRSVRPEPLGDMIVFTGPEWLRVEFKPKLIRLGCAALAGLQQRG